MFRIGHICKYKNILIINHAYVLSLKRNYVPVFQTGRENRPHIIFEILNHNLLSDDCFIEHHSADGDSISFVIDDEKRNNFRALRRAIMEAKEIESSMVPLSCTKMVNTLKRI